MLIRAAHRFSIYHLYWYNDNDTGNYSNDMGIDNCFVNINSLELFSEFIKFHGNILISIIDFIHSPTDIA